MCRCFCLPLAHALALAIGLGLPSTVAAAQRSFVSSDGSDANTATNCGLTTPCRGFSAALSVTDAGGEIVVLKSGGFGAVTINKSVSIVSPEGIHAGISVTTPSSNGITIATSGTVVHLKGIAIAGLAANTYGIHMTNGSKLTLDRCTIANFSTTSHAGLFVNTAAEIRILNSVFRENYYGVILSNGASASVSETRFLGNLQHGLRVTDYYGGSGVTTSAYVDHAVANGNTIGFTLSNSSSANIGRLTVSDSQITDNNYGLFVSGTAGAAHATASNNRLHANTIAMHATDVAAKLVLVANTFTKNGSAVVRASSAVVESSGDNAMRDNTYDFNGGLSATFAKQ